MDPAALPDRPEARNVKKAKSKQLEGRTYETFINYLCENKIRYSRNPKPKNPCMDAWEIKLNQGGIKNADRSKQ